MHAGREPERGGGILSRWTFFVCMYVGKKGKKSARTSFNEWKCILYVCAL